jgi:glucokinase
VGDIGNVNREFLLEPTTLRTLGMAPTDVTRHTVDTLDNHLARSRINAEHPAPGAAVVACYHDYDVILTNVHFLLHNHLIRAKICIQPCTEGAVIGLAGDANVCFPADYSKI